MEKLHAIAIYVFWGMPVWVWALVLGLGATNEYINRTKRTEAQSILQGIFSFILKLPALGVLLLKFPILGVVMKDIATPPDAEHEKIKPLEPSQPPVADILPFLLPLLMFQAACACWTPERRHSKECVILHQTIDCTKDSIVGMLPSAVSSLMQLISGGSPDWNMLLDNLKAGGFDNAACILASLDVSFSSKLGAAPDAKTTSNAQAVAELLRRFKSENGIGEVQIKVPTGNGKWVTR